MFRLNNSGVSASASYGASPVGVAGDNAVLVTFSPATDLTSGHLVASGCLFATEAKLVSNTNGTVTWAIGVKGRPNLAPTAPGPNADAYAYIVKLLA